MKLGYSELDIATARVVVRRLVANGWRKGPSEMLVLSDHQLEQWWREDAIAWLDEHRQKHYSSALEIK